MAYIRGGGGNIKRKPLITGFWEGTSATSFSFNAKVGDLIVYSGGYLPTITGATEISTWRTSSDISGKSGGLYRVTSNSVSVSISGSNYNVTVFSSSTKTQLEYDLITMGGSNVWTTVNIKEDEILAYPQRNTLLSISGDARKIMPSANYRADIIRGLSDSSIQIRTSSGVGLTVVKIY